MWTFKDEPKGKAYEDLVDIASSICNQFILVQRNDVGLSKKAEDLICELTPYLIEKKKLQSWPGTELLDDYAIVYYYSLNEESKKLIKKYTNGLYSWKQPTLLEDLCFIKGNGEPWLNNVCHEKFSWISNAANVEILKVKSIKGVTLIKR